MPRSTDKTFLQSRTQLTILWNDDADPARQFFYLTAREQWDLRAYFQFTVKLSDQDAVLHRRAVTHSQPSLPHRAGRALARLERLITNGPEADPTYQRQRRAARRAALVYAKAHDKKPRALSVRAEMQPEPDAKKFAQALIQIARQRLADEHESTAATPLIGSLRTDPRSAGDSSHPNEVA